MATHQIKPGDELLPPEQKTIIRSEQSENVEYFSIQSLHGELTNNNDRIEKLQERNAWLQDRINKVKQFLGI